MTEYSDNYLAELELLSPDRFARLRALGKLRYGTDSLYALRNTILADSAAEVRTSAIKILATWLVRFAPDIKGPEAIDLLIEACTDSAARVRQAALGALTLLKASCAVSCGVAGLQDTVWWVRRSAVDLVAIQGSAAVDPLLAALDDPFWRVRYTALLALARLGQDAPELQARLARPMSDDSEVRAAALLYLRRRWSEEPQQALLTPNDPPLRSDDIWDPDPAVMAARLEASDVVVSAASLVELLADPHEHLRTGAVKHLVRLHSTRAFWATLLWLDEPRIPYAHATTTLLLNSLGTTAGDLVQRVLKEASPGWGAIGWALHWVAASKSSEFRALVRTYAEHECPNIRQAVFQALEQLRPTEADAVCIAKGLSDAHRMVRLRAAQSVASARSQRLDALLDALPYTAQCVYMRRLLVQRAAKASHTLVLQYALEDNDAKCRAIALHTMAIAGSLPASESLRAVQSADPWIRAAVTSQHSSALLEDRSPIVQRASIEWLCNHASCGTQAAGLVAATSADERLRTRAANLLAPQANLLALLTLAQDTSGPVRSAASQRLSGWKALDTNLLLLLKTSTSALVRKTAYTFLCRDFDERASTLVLEGLSHETSSSVHEHLQAIALGCGLHMPSPKPAAAPVAATPAIKTPQDSHRQLGRTSIELSPIIISGANSIAPSVLEKARQRGVSSFFWEPNYQQLTTYLRSSPTLRSELTLIAGTYEQSAITIEADLDRTLRRLKTDYLDVFLLFWVRSPKRVDTATFAAMSKLKASGKVRAIGFSTHHRDIATSAITDHNWDVLMLRHSAAHPGAERELLPAAQVAGVGVLSFSNLCYGRMLKRRAGHWTPTASDCYRYSLTQPGVSASISAPRTYEETMENLQALTTPTLGEAKLEAIRDHGSWVYGQNNDFKSLVRRTPREAIQKSNAKIDELLGEKRL